MNRHGRERCGNKLYELIGNGTIPSMKLGKHVVVPKKGLEKRIHEAVS